MNSAVVLSNCKGCHQDYSIKGPSTYHGPSILTLDPVVINSILGIRFRNCFNYKELELLKSS